MQVIEIAESFRGLGILLIAKGFRPDVILANDTSFLTIRGALYGDWSIDAKRLTFWLQG